MADSNEPQQPNMEQDQAIAGQGPSFAQATITSILSSAHNSLPDNNNSNNNNNNNNNDGSSSNNNNNNSNNNSGVKRPRDARLIHMILAAWGVSAYEERVPLQLLDFAYRYTTNVLQDALYMSSEGYASSSTANRASSTTITAVTTTATGAGTGSGAAGTGTGTGNAPINELNAFNANYVKLGIENRNRHQHNNEIPKDFLLDLALERNKVALPSVGRDWGVRLPPEKFCLTGVGWSLKEDWLSPTDDDGDDDDHHHGMDTIDHGGGNGGHSSSWNHHPNVVSAAGNHHRHNHHVRNVDEDNDDDNDDDDTRMEDLFGDSLADGNGNGHDHDRDGLENDVQGRDRSMTDR